MPHVTNVTKLIAYVLAAIVGLAALITSLLYDWENKEAGETHVAPTSVIQP
jgi:hypothetical protein